MDLLESEGFVWAIVLAILVLALTAACYAGGIVTTSTAVSAYHSVVSGVDHVVKEAVTDEVSETVDYNCGDYGHSKTLVETVDRNDPFGVQNADKRLAKRINVEITKLIKQGCVPIVLH